MKTVHANVKEPVDLLTLYNKVIAAVNAPKLALLPEFLIVKCADVCVTQQLKKIV